LYSLKKINLPEKLLIFRFSRVEGVGCEAKPLKGFIVHTPKTTLVDLQP
jgi:hypothetical protein